MSSRGEGLVAQPCFVEAVQVDQVSSPVLLLGLMLAVAIDPCVGRQRQESFEGVHSSLVTAFAALQLEKPVAEWVVKQQEGSEGSLAVLLVLFVAL